MTTESNHDAGLSRPATPLSPLTATRLRLHQRVRAVPPRRIGAVALALVVGGSTWSVVNAARTNQAQWGDVLAVVVAVSDIEPGEELTPVNTELRAIPLALLPQNALTDDRSGRRAGSPIGTGQVVVDGQVAIDRHGLEAQGRSITLPQPLAPPALIVGDTVELISVRATRDRVSAVSIATVEVVEISENGITVTVNQSLAAAVFEALASGSVEFARRPPQG